MKYTFPIIALILTVGYLATPWVQSEKKVTSSFIKVTILSCNKIKDVYFKKDLKLIPKFFQDNITCGITYPGVRISKNSIITFNSMYETRIFPSSNGLLRIDSFNNEYCHLRLLENPRGVDINLTCSELEDRL